MYNSFFNSAYLHTPQSTRSLSNSSLQTGNKSLSVSHGGKLYAIKYNQWKESQLDVLRLLKKVIPHINNAEEQPVPPHWDWVSTRVLLSGTAWRISHTTCSLARYTSTVICSHASCICKAATDLVLKHWLCVTPELMQHVNPSDQV